MNIPSIKVQNCGQCANCGDIEAFEIAISALEQTNTAEYPCKTCPQDCDTTCEIYKEWCHDCKEYDQENHCCHRYSSFIRETLQDNIDAVLEDIKEEIKGMTPTYHNSDWSITDLFPISEVLKLINKHISGKEKE